MNIIIFTLITVFLTVPPAVGQVETITYEQMQRQLANEAQEGLNADPDNAELYIKRGIAYRMQGDNTSAIEEFSRAIELEPQNAEAYKNRAMSLASGQIGQTVNALSDIDMAIELDPGNGEYYFVRALSYADMGDVDEVRRDVQQAQSLGFEVPAQLMKEMGLKDEPQSQRKGYFTASGAYIEPAPASISQVEREKREFYERLETAKRAGKEVYLSTTLSDGTVLQGSSVDKKTSSGGLFNNRLFIIVAILLIGVSFLLFRS